MAVKNKSGTESSMNEFSPQEKKVKKSKDLYYILGGFKTDFLSEKNLKDKKMKILSDLKEHVTPEMELRGEPSDYEFILRGDILPLETKINEISTSKDTPLQIVHWFMHYKDNDPNWDFFFGDRRWSILYIIDSNKLQRFIEDIINPNFQPKDSFWENFNDSYKHSAFQKEVDMYPLVNQLLTAALKDSPNLLIANQYKLAYEGHSSVPDHVIYNSLEHGSGNLVPLLLITEDKLKLTDNYHAPFVQNFDQLLTYSFLVKDQTAFFGITTDLKKWRFTCYIKPPHQKAPTIDHFIMSKEYSTQMNALDQDLLTILRIINGLLTNNPAEKIKDYINEVNAIV
jgi:hypothetical protein